MKLARIINKIKYIFFLLRVHSSDELGKAKIYAQYYRVRMGKNVRITGNIHFPTEAYLITIGDNVTLTNNITFHTHDGGVGLFRSEFKGINVFGEIKIGNNVFIGSNTTILPNVSIGSNVVIGASSVVTKDVPDNVVVAGNPSRVLSTLEEYKQKALGKASYIYASDTEQRQSEIINAIKGRNQ